RQAAARSWPLSKRCLTEGPEEEVIAHAAPDADQPLRFENEKEDHDDAESGIVDGKDGTREAVRSREGGHGTFDHIGKERDKQSAEQRPEQAAHPADDDHGNVLDREIEGESLDRYEAAVICE